MDSTLCMKKNQPINILLVKWLMTSALNVKKHTETHEDTVMAYRNYRNVPLNLWVKLLRCNCYTSCMEWWKCFFFNYLIHFKLKLGLGCSTQSSHTFQTGPKTVLKFVKRYYGIINLKPDCVSLLRGVRVLLTHEPQMLGSLQRVLGESCKIICVRLHHSQRQGVWQFSAP